MTTSSFATPAVCFSFAPPRLLVRFYVLLIRSSPLVEIPLAPVVRPIANSGFTRYIVDR
jgi:hypothetical protein